MGREDDEGFYQRLSKKELQDLCKRHGLSPCMTKPNLVSSLHSYFKAAGCTAVQCSKDCGGNSHLTSNNVETVNSQNALRFNDSDLDAQGKCRNICSCKNNVTSGSDAGVSNGPQTRSRTKGASAKDDMAAHSFEFFASSEEGIKLTVDLNSISSDWSKALNSSVCCCHYLSSNKFPSLREELELLENRSKQRKDVSPTNTNFGHETNKHLQGPPYSNKGECEPLVPELCSVARVMHAQEKEIVVIDVSSGSESSPTNKDTVSVERNDISSGLIELSSDSIFYSATEDLSSPNLLEHQKSGRATDIQSSEVVNERTDVSSSLRRSNRLHQVADLPVSEECTPACTKQRGRSKLSNEAETSGSLQPLEKTSTASEGVKVLKRTRQHSGGINPNYSLPNVKVLRSHKLLLGPRKSPRLPR